MGPWMWPPPTVVFASLLSLTALLFRAGTSQMYQGQGQFVPMQAYPGVYGNMQNPFMMMSQPMAPQETFQQQQMRQAPQFMSPMTFSPQMMGGGGGGFQGQQGGFQGQQGFQSFFPQSVNTGQQFQFPTMDSTGSQNTGQFSNVNQQQAAGGQQPPAPPPAAAADSSGIGGTDSVRSTVPAAGPAAVPATGSGSTSETAGSGTASSVPSPAAAAADVKDKIEPPAAAAAAPAVPASIVTDDSGTTDEKPRDAESSASKSLPAAAPPKPNKLPKSKLFAVNANIFDPTSLAALKTQVQLTRFQIWWLTNHIIRQVDDRLRPDYVFMLPSPFQQGIPSVNISQVLVSPMVRHEVLRALIDGAPGMIPSQLAAILNRVRISDPMIVKSVLSSSNPSKLLGLINPREVRRNMRMIIKTIAEMPETGRFGITSVQAKLLPKNVLGTWLKFTNVTRWSAPDLLGQTPLGATNEIQLAIMGLSCRDIRTLPPPEIFPVINFLRRELYSIRAFQDVGFPMELRQCTLEKVIEYLSTKPGQSRTGHVLDRLNPAEIKALGGEILSGIPISALKQIKPQTQFFILNEIGRLDPISLIKFAPIKKLQWYGRTLFGDPEPTPVQAPPPDLSGRSAPDEQASTTDGSSAESLDPASNPESSKDVQPTESTENKKGSSPAASAEKSDSKTGTAGSAGISEGTPAEGKASQPAGAGPSPVKSGSETAPKDRRRRMHGPGEENAETLRRMGSLFCYTSPLVRATWENQTIRDFLDQKESLGEKTCCMTKSMRTQWSRLLKATYGPNVTAWSEFDLVGMGDLIVALSDRDIRSLSVKNLSRVASTLIKQSGFTAMIELPGQGSKMSFVEACQVLLGDEDEAEAYRKAQRNFYRHLSHATQWMLNPEITNVAKMAPTCDGIILAGPAASGYTIDDFQLMEPQDMFECIEAIGALDFDAETKMELLQFFKEAFKLTSKQLNILTLIELGNLVSQLNSHDVSDLPLFLPEAMDSVAIMGSQITAPDSLKAVATKFSNDNRLLPGMLGIGRSISLRTVVRSLGNIICGMNEQVMSNIFESDPPLFLETSPNVGTVTGCSASMLQVIASHAVRPANYGPPETWTAPDVRTVGIIVAGLSPDMLGRITPEAMEGLTPAAMQAFTASSLRALTPAQIRGITAQTAQAVDATLLETLTPEQADAFKVVLAPSRDAFVADPRMVKMAGGPALFTGLLGDSDIEHLSADMEPEDSDLEQPDLSEEPPQDLEARAASEEEATKTVLNATEATGVNRTGFSEFENPEKGTMDIVEEIPNGTTAAPETTTATTDEAPRQDLDVSDKPSSGYQHCQNSYMVVVCAIIGIVSIVIRS